MKIVKLKYIFPYFFSLKYFIEENIFFFLKLCISLLYLLNKLFSFPMCSVAEKKRELIIHFKFQIVKEKNVTSRSTMPFSIFVKQISLGGRLLTEIVSHTKIFNTSREFWHRISIFRQNIP